MEMWVYIVRRVLLAIFVVIGMITITFFLTHVVPSDPAQLYVGPKATAEELEHAREVLGLNKPLYIQYLDYMRNVFKGDWGVSLRTKNPVLDEIFHYLPHTLELIIFGYIIALIVGVSLGILSAVYKDSVIDNIIRFIAIGEVSIPSFAFAIILQLIFYRQLGILPLQGRTSFLEIPQITGFLLIDSLLVGDFNLFLDALKHLILPGLAVASYPIGLITRMLRATMIVVLNMDYIKFAKACGLPKNIILKYATKNAFIPVLTVFALSFAYSLAGAVLIEIIFAWPGIGTYALTAIQNMDYPVVIGIVVLVSIFYVSINLVVDILQAYLDPRVRLG